MKPGNRVSGVRVLACLLIGSLSVEARKGDVVYLADQEVVARTELYRAPAGGAPVIKLNAPLTAAARVHSFQLQPRGDVIYLEVLPGKGGALYHSRLRDGLATRIDGVASGYTHIEGFGVGPRGRVVFQGDPDGDGVPDLHLVDTRRGTARPFGIALNPGDALPSPDSAGTLDVAFDRRGQTVYFKVYEGASDRQLLFGYEVRSGAITALTPDLPVHARIHDVLPGRRGRFVYATSDVDADAVRELSRIDVTSGAILPLYAPDSGGVFSLRMSPRQRHLAFEAVSATAGPFEVSLVNLRDHTIVPLHAPLLPGQFAFDPEFDTRSRYVFFWKHVTGDDGLHRVSLRTGEVDTVSTEQPAITYRVAPRGRHVLFPAVADAFGIGDLQLADVPTNLVSSLEPSVPPSVDTPGFTFSPGGRSVVTLSNREGLDAMTLHRVRLTTGEATPIGPPPVDGGRVRLFSLVGVDGQEGTLPTTIP